MKVILSTFGPLHLVKSAEYLNNFVNIRVIQGWLPSWWNKWFLAVASKIVGRNLFKAFERRTPVCFEGKNRSIALAEFYLWACKLFKLQSPMKSSYSAAMIYGWQSKRYLKDADIFHVRSGSGFNGAIERAKANGMKVVVDHSIAYPAFMDKQLRDEYTKNGALFNLGMDNPFWTEIVEDCRKGDVVLVNSQFVKDTFVENGFAPEKIKVALLGVRKDFRSLKTNYDLKDDNLRILFTGGFGFRKGAEYILRALAELDKENFKYEFTCVGDSGGAIDLINEIGAKHITRVNTVPQDDLKSYLANSDVYLFPSLCEGCASSGMEALAAGLPVIATKESGLPIEDGVDGIIVKSKNVDVIVEALKRVATDKAFRERMGKTAAKKIADNFTWEQYAHNVVNMYKELLNT
jgi:glycosyltransferase involved in cell wall biosynthesis